jgi:hypothetical protein
VSFGGFGLADAARRVPPVPGVTWILASPMRDLGRPDTRFVPGDAGISYVALLAACDAVFTKPGYGILAEASAQQTRILYTDRGDFPEYPYLVRWMHEHGPAAHVASAKLDGDTASAALRGALDELFAVPGRWTNDTNGGERVAALVTKVLGMES